jgi:hypothetical protein
MTVQSWANTCTTSGVFTVISAVSVMVDKAPAPVHIRPRNRSVSTISLSKYPSEYIECKDGSGDGEDDQDLASALGPLLVAGIASSHTSLQEEAVPKRKGILKKTNRANYADKSAEADPELDIQPLVVKDFVVERRQSKQKSVKGPVCSSPNLPTGAAYAIEGFTPKRPFRTADLIKAPSAMHEGHTYIGTYRDSGKVGADDHDVADELPRSASTKPVIAGADKDDAECEPLVFNSFADILEMAGTLPKQDSQETPQVIEAGLEFSCMAPDEYKEFQDEVLQEQFDMFLGTTDAPDEDAPWDPEDPTDDGEDVDSDSSKDTRPWEPRAFLKLWNAISQWISPEAVTYVRHLRSHQDENEYYSIPQIHRSDVCASRCAGLMAMLQMHTNKCLVQELQRSTDQIRNTERRLANLVRCFDFTRPVPKLDSAHTRALTSILLVTVMDNADLTDVHLVPECCELVGLNLDEYRYLSRSAIVNFGTPTD